MKNNYVRPAQIQAARAITQQELDDAQEIQSMFTSNTRSHLEAQRNLRNETHASLTQRLNLD